jgi:hypothetical protein
VRFNRIERVSDRPRDGTRGRAARHRFYRRKFLFFSSFFFFSFFSRKVSLVFSPVSL